MSRDFDYISNAPIDFELKPSKVKKRLVEPQRQVEIFEANAGNLKALEEQIREESQDFETPFIDLYTKYKTAGEVKPLMYNINAADDASHGKIKSALDNAQMFLRDKHKDAVNNKGVFSPEALIYGGTKELVSLAGMFPSIAEQFGVEAGALFGSIESSDDAEDAFKVLSGLNGSILGMVGQHIIDSSEKGLTLDDSIIKNGGEIVGAAIPKITNALIEEYRDNPAGLLVAAAGLDNLLVRAFLPGGFNAVANTAKNVAGTTVMATAIGAEASSRVASAATRAARGASIEGVLTASEKFASADLSNVMEKLVSKPVAKRLFDVKKKFAGVSEKALNYSAAITELVRGGRIGVEEATEKISSRLLREGMDPKAVKIVTLNFDLQYFASEIGTMSKADFADYVKRIIENDITDTSALKQREYNFFFPRELQARAGADFLETFRKHNHTYVYKANDIFNLTEKEMVEAAGNAAGISLTGEETLIKVLDSFVSADDPASLFSKTVANMAEKAKNKKIIEEGMFSSIMHEIESGGIYRVLYADEVAPETLLKNTVENELGTDHSIPRYGKKEKAAFEDALNDMDNPTSNTVRQISAEIADKERSARTMQKYILSGDIQGLFSHKYAISKKAVDDFIKNVAIPGAKSEGVTVDAFLKSRPELSSRYNGLISEVRELSDAINATRAGAITQGIEEIEKRINSTLLPELQKIEALKSQRLALKSKLLQNIRNSDVAGTAYLNSFFQESAELSRHTSIMSVTKGVKNVFHNLQEATSLPVYDYYIELEAATLLAPKFFNDTWSHKLSAVTKKVLEDGTTRSYTAKEKVSLNEMIIALTKGETGAFYRLESAASEDVKELLGKFLQYQDDLYRFHKQTKYALVNPLEVVDNKAPKYVATGEVTAKKAGAYTRELKPLPSRDLSAIIRDVMDQQEYKDFIIRGRDNAVYPGADSFDLLDDIVKTTKTLITEEVIKPQIEKFKELSEHFMKQGTDGAMVNTSTSAFFHQFAESASGKPVGQLDAYTKEFFYRQYRRFFPDEQVPNDVGAQAMSRAHQMFIGGMLGFNTLSATKNMLQKAGYIGEIGTRRSISSFMGSFKHENIEEAIRHGVVTQDITSIYTDYIDTFESGTKSFWSKVKDVATDENTVMPRSSGFKRRMWEKYKNKHEKISTVGMHFFQYYGDLLSRVQGYVAAKELTMDAFEKFKKHGSVQQFLDDSGVTTTARKLDRDRLTKLFDNGQGDLDAFIGQHARNLAEKTQYNYQSINRPIASRSFFGKEMFFLTTWPRSYVEMYGQRYDTLKRLLQERGLKGNDLLMQTSFNYMKEIGAQTAAAWTLGGVFGISALPWFFLGPTSSLVEPSPTASLASSIVGAGISLGTGDNAGAKRQAKKAVKTVAYSALPGLKFLHGNLGKALTNNTREYKGKEIKIQKTLPTFLRELFGFAPTIDAVREESVESNKQYSAFKEELAEQDSSYSRNYGRKYSRDYK